MNREWDSEYVPFSSNKIIYWMRYWRSIKWGMIPPPPFITIDPTNACNLACKWCNSKAVREAVRNEIPRDNISYLCKFLREWGVQAVCLAGGGEPTCYGYLEELVDGLVASGIETGMITNGVNLGWLDSDCISKFRWIGVSVDAGTAETFEYIKGKDLFDAVKKNIQYAAFYTEVTYKYLVSPMNSKEIAGAAKLAKSLGCRYFHARPVSVPWDEMENEKVNTTVEIQRKIARGLLKSSMRLLECGTFSVIGMMHKVDSDTWKPKNDFEKCWAIFMTCVFYPDGRIGLCCDRRGDDSLILGKWDKGHPPWELWNSDRHKELQKVIDVSRCPRCTHAKHNRIYEEYMLKDSICKNFY